MDVGGERTHRREAIRGIRGCSRPMSDSRKRQPAGITKGLPCADARLSQPPETS